MFLTFYRRIWNQHFPRSFVKHWNWTSYKRNYILKEVSIKEQTFVHYIQIFVRIAKLLSYSIYLIPLPSKGREINTLLFVREKLRCIRFPSSIHIDGNNLNTLTLHSKTNNTHRIFPSANITQRRTGFIKKIPDIIILPE